MSMKPAWTCKLQECDPVRKNTKPNKPPKDQRGEESSAPQALPSLLVKGPLTLHLP